MDTPQDEKELREEWSRTDELDFINMITGNTSYSRIADWWLSKRAEEHKQLVERVEKYRDSLKGKSSHGNCCTCVDCRNFHDDCTCTEIRTVDAVLCLLTPKVEVTEEKV